MVSVGPEKVRGFLVKDSNDLKNSSCMSNGYGMDSSTVIVRDSK